MTYNVISHFLTHEDEDDVVADEDIPHSARDPSSVGCHFQPNHRIWSIAQHDRGWEHLLRRLCGAHTDVCLLREEYIRRRDAWRSRMLDLHYACPVTDEEKQKADIALFWLPTFEALLSAMIIIGCRGR